MGNNVAETFISEVFLNKLKSRKIQLYFPDLRHFIIFIQLLYLRNPNVFSKPYKYIFIKRFCKNIQ